MKPLGSERITYRDRSTSVELGDHIETRIWFRKYRGRVVCLPGASSVNPAMEHGGLRWVGIRLEEGGFVSAVVDPDASYVRNKITLVGRDSYGFEELAPDDDPHTEGVHGGP